jgi:hypothetical protein
MNGLPTSDKQRKYLTDIQTALGHAVAIPKKSKACGKLIKKLLPQFIALNNRVE